MLLVRPGPLYALTALEITSALRAPIEAGSTLEYVFDPNDQFTIDSISDPTSGLNWVVSDKATPSFGYRQGTVWARLAIHDARPERVPLILEMAYPPLDEIELYFRSEAGWKHLRAGDHVPRSKWALDTRNPAFRLPLAHDANENIFFIKLRSSSSVILPLKIMEEPAFQRNILREESIQSLYFGALLILGLYNLLVFLSSRLTFYAAYVIFLVGYGTFQAAFGGQWHYYSSSLSPLTSDYILVQGMNLMSIGITAFILSVFELKERPKIRKYWQRSGYFILSITIFNLIAALWLPYRVVLNIAMSLGFLGTTFSLVSAALGFRQKERMAKWFLLAWSFFLFGTVVNLLRSLGMTASNVWTIYSQQIGSALEFTLLSFAMADRIKMLQERINKERDSALKAEQAAREADQRALEASEAALAEQKRLAALKDQFLANTSHELRTPLNGMIGMSEALLNRNHLQEDEVAAVHEILGASRHLSKLVNNILDFSASKQGSIEIKIETVDMKQLVRTSLAQQANAFPDKGVSIQDQLPAEDILIQADSGRCLQVLNEILSNAFKFTEKGRIIVRSKVEDDFVELMIRDTGIGISADRLANLNQAFEQGDGAAGRKHGGAGLGLALAQRLIAAQGGTLHIQSAAGLGTTVILRFQRSHEISVPLQKVVPDHQAISVPEPAPKHTVPQTPGPVLQLVKATAPPSLNKPENQVRVLVVDDDSLNRRVIREHLMNKRFDITEAASGAEALQYIETEPPFDVVLLDVMMPGMTGYDVSRKIRTRFSPTDLPILMLTAKQQVQDMVEGFQSGANDYVYKPFVKDELLSRLETHLGISQTARAMRRFVPHDFIQMLGHQHLTELQLGEAVSRDMSILFADIAGFTKILETLPVNETFAWLNRCYRILGPEIRRAGGFIDKYIGDAVMALFPGSADDAVAAALNMHQGIKNVQDVTIGTGIHWGQTMLGTLGEPERFETTVLSDSVNIASRVEGASKILGCPILVSAALKNAMSKPGLYRWRNLGSIRLKGRGASVELHELLDADENFAAKLANLDEFEAGIRAFKSGQFLQAGLHFQSVLDKLPQDGPAKFYLERCQQLQSGKYEFDGTLVLSEKS
jgi:signal transduction histidine kinase/class 3 adenylate cyclase